MLLDDKPKFFGRRVGRKIRVAKSFLLSHFLAKVTFSTFDFCKNFAKNYLEIGFGDGSHLAELSARHHNIGFIGAEVFQNGVASLLSLITGVKEGNEVSENINLLPERADNLRIFADDVRLLF